MKDNVTKIMQGLGVFVALLFCGSVLLAWLAFVVLIVRSAFGW